MMDLFQISILQYYIIKLSMTNLFSFFTLFLSLYCSLSLTETHTHSKHSLFAHSMTYNVCTVSMTAFNSDVTVTSDDPL